MSKSVTLFRYIALLFVGGAFPAISQSLTSPSGGSQTLRHIPAYTATEWITVTQPLADGSTETATRRIEVSRDTSGQWTRAIYHATKGPQYDVSAKLDHTITGLTVSLSKTLALPLATGEVLENDEDLGTRIQNGLVTLGRRRTYASTTQQSSARHILESWYAPDLGVVMHSESHNLGGSTVIVDLTNLQLGSVNPAPTPTVNGGVASAVSRAHLDLRLYQALFSIVANMEKARIAEAKTSTGYMAAAEESLRKDLKLSPAAWQSFVETSVKVDTYVQGNSNQAQALVRQARGASQQSLPNSAIAQQTKSLLRTLQSDQDSRVTGDVQKLEAAIGSASIEAVLEFLHGPFAASTHPVPLKVRSQVSR